MPAAHQIHVILFDLGGVLVELTGAPKLLSLIGDRLPSEDLWAQWLASPVVRAFETGRIAPDQFAARLIQELKLPINADHFLGEFTRLPKGLFAGTFDLLKRIAPSYTRATLSNNNVLHWPRLMDEMQLHDKFDYHFPSHLIGKIKPDADAFHNVIATLGCTASAILFLDDNAVNVESARCVGIKAEQVHGVRGAEQALLAYGLLGAI
jgi:putative hydrolase of the HAD superfamily